MTGSGFAEYTPNRVPEGTVLAGPVEVRPAAGGDIDKIREIDTKAGRAPASADALSSAVLDEARLVVVASVDGNIVGWGKTHFWSYADGPAPAGNYLGGITVIPELRRHGIARELTQARLDWIWGRADSAWYVVNPSNQASIDLHCQWGFTEVARAAKFHTTIFTGGVGLLLQAKQSGSYRLPYLNTAARLANGTAHQKLAPYAVPQLVRQPPPA